MAQVKLLVWKGKHGDEYFDVGTAAKKNAALRSLFAQLNDPGSWDFYNDLRTGEDPEQVTPCHTCGGTGKVVDPYFRQRRLKWDIEKGYYDKALKGDPQAIERLLFSRRDGEYEWVEYTNVRETESDND